MEQGYISVFRKIMNNEIWYDKPSAWLKVWLYLLLNVEYQQTSELQRGQGIFTFKKIHKECFLEMEMSNYQSIRHVIRFLLSHNYIEIKKLNRHAGMLITIINYDTYQISPRSHAKSHAKISMTCHANISSNIDDQSHAKISFSTAQKNITQGHAKISMTKCHESHAKNDTESHAKSHANSQNTNFLMNDFTDNYDKNKNSLYIEDHVQDINIISLNKEEINILSSSVSPLKISTEFTEERMKKKKSKKIQFNITKENMNIITKYVYFEAEKRKNSYNPIISIPAYKLHTIEKLQEGKLDIKDLELQLPQQKKECPFGICKGRGYILGTKKHNDLGYVDVISSIPCLCTHTNYEELNANKWLEIIETEYDLSEFLLQTI